MNISLTRYKTKDKRNTQLFYFLPHFCLPLPPTLLLKHHIRDLVLSSHAIQTALVTHRFRLQANEVKTAQRYCHLAHIFHLVNRIPLDSRLMEVAVLISSEDIMTFAGQTLSYITFSGNIWFIFFFYHTECGRNTIKDQDSLRDIDVLLIATWNVFFPHNFGMQQITFL